MGVDRAEGGVWVVATRSARLTVGLLAALVALLVVGSVGAVAVGRHQRETGGMAGPNGSAIGPSMTHATTLASASAPAASATRRNPPSRPPAKSSGTAAPTESSSSSAAAAGSSAGSDPSTAPVGPSNNLTVQMSQVTRAHARAQDVLQALQSYFDAINQHDYTSWKQSVTEALAAHQTGQQWLLAYATTVDSSIWMQSMRDNPLQVQIRFTSQQDPDLAPTDLQVGCIHWSLTYQVADEHGQLSIGSTVDGSVNYVKC
jgi:hypothetical protein